MAESNRHLGFRALVRTSARNRAYRRISLHIASPGRPPQWREIPVKRYIRDARHSEIGVVAMQKVEGSNPFSRLIGSPLPERASAFSGLGEGLARRALAAARCPIAAQADRGLRNERHADCPGSLAKPWRRRGQNVTSLECSTFSGSGRCSASLASPGLMTRVHDLRRVLDELLKWEARFVTFSDTILLYSRPIPDPINSAHEFLIRVEADAFFRYSAALQAQALMAGLPLRGGVAFGECVVTPTRGVFVGPPIVDAYLLSEAQDWIGVALHSSCDPLVSVTKPPEMGVAL